MRYGGIGTAGVSMTRSLSGYFAFRSTRSRLCGLSLLFRLFELFPFEVAAVTCREILEFAVAFEDEQVIGNLIHEVAVVRHDDQTARVGLQVLFKHLQRQDVEVVGRLVEHQEIRIAHQDRAEVEPAPLTAAEFRNEVVLGLRRE